MTDPRYLDKAWNEYEDHEIDFEALRERTDVWIERAFELLSNSHTLYRLAAKALEGKRSKEAAFPNCELDNEANDELYKLFLHDLSSEDFPLDAKSRIVKQMSPSRLFLFQVMKTEIKQLKATGAVPETYLELDREYSDIIKELCISGILLVPKLCWEPKGNLSPSERQGEGNLGLVLAAHKYAFNRVKNGTPVKFSTVARLWILERIYERIRRDTFYLQVDNKARNAFFQKHKGIETDNALALDALNAAYPVPLEDGTEEDGTPIAENIDNSYGIGSPIADPDAELEKKNWSAAACKIFRKHLTPTEFDALYRKFELLNGEFEMNNFTISRKTGVPMGEVKEVIRHALEKLVNEKECLELISQLGTCKAVPVTT